MFKISSGLISCQRNLTTKCYIQPFLLFNKASIHHSHIESLKVFFFMPTSLRTFFSITILHTQKELKTLFSCTHTIMFMECTEEDGTKFTLSRFSQANHIMTKKEIYPPLIAWTTHLGKIVWE